MDAQNEYRTGRRYTPYKCIEPVYIDFTVFTSYYARMYCVPGYTSQPHPSQRPQSRGSSLEPRDMPRNPCVKPIEILPIN